MKLKQFQIDDLSRLTLTDGAILAWDPGLGKTWAEILWALLKLGYTTKPGGTSSASPTSELVPNGTVLLVVPGGLHDQTIEEARRIFRVHITRLDSQEKFHLLSRPGRFGMGLPRGFYITSFTQLGQNGVEKPPQADSNNPDSVAAMFAILQSFDRTVTQARAANEYEVAWLEALEKNLGTENAGVVRVSDLFPGVKGNSKLGRYFRNLDPAYKSLFLARWLNAQFAKIFAGIGHSREYKNGGTSSESPTSSFKVKCVYSPTLSDLSVHTFDAVAVDEATRMKSDTGLLANGVRQLQPRFRLVMTATPIKNRLPDIFHLLHWAVAGNLARFPFEQDEIKEFAQTFCVSESILAVNGDDTNGGRKTLTPQVCNVHKIWKMIAPNILRRRKKDIGTAIVPKHNHLIRVPMGTVQRAIIRAHLDWKPLDCNGRIATGKKVTALRQAAAYPESSPLFAHTLDRLRHPENHRRHDWPVIPSDIADPARAILESSIFNHQSSIQLPTPKLAACLKLIEQILARGEQFLVYSPFIDPLVNLSSILNAAGVRHFQLDGDVSESRRGKIVHEFRKGPHAQVNYPRIAKGSCGPCGEHQAAGLLVTDCMAEGHNLPRCNNIILYSYPWALDKILQVIDRVHRLSSDKPVNVYRLITDGTIDRRMEQGIDEKDDAQELVLDGHLIGEAHAELSMRELLQVAESEFETAKDTVPETHLQTELASIALALESTMRTWPHATVGRGVPASPVQTSTRSASKPAWWKLLRPKAQAPKPAIIA